MTKKNRLLIYNKYKGMCSYCGCDLTEKWHVDHIVPVVRNMDGSYRYPNEELENLNPSCASCNILKNSYTIEQFRENIKNFVSSLNKYSTQYKVAKRYGLVEDVDIEVVFHFEKTK